MNTRIFAALFLITSPGFAQAPVRVIPRTAPGAAIRLAPTRVQLPTALARPSAPLPVLPPRMIPAPSPSAPSVNHSVLSRITKLAAPSPNVPNADPAKIAELAATFDGAKAKPAGVSIDWVRDMIEDEGALAPDERRLRDAVQRLGFQEVALNKDILKRHTDSYTLELSQGPITDQKSSGRCWIFAGLNMVRSMMLASISDDAARAKAAKDLELSENYLHFFNMLEKSQGHLDLAAEKLYRQDKTLTAKKRRDVATPGLGDGGWFEYFTHLASKYGIVPKSAMGETISSEATAVLLAELEESLSASTAELMANAKAVKAGEAQDLSEQIKGRGMKRAWKILATHLGAPPAKIEIREAGKAETKDGVKVTPAIVKTMTPQEYARDVAKFDPTDYVPVGNYPSKKRGRLYEIKKSGMTGVSLKFLNVAPERMEELTAAALRGGQPVYFGAAIRQDVDRKTGIMHPQIFDRAPIYGYKEGEAPELTRKQAAYFGNIAPTHAMVLTGLDQPDPAGPIVKFKVENSWGEKTGSKGIYHLYREWFLDNVFEVVVHKRFLNEAEQGLWSGKATPVKRKN
jgi:bleomycin hydrolase